jgi:hypothetical protein
LNIKFVNKQHFNFLSKIWTPIPTFQKICNNSLNHIQRIVYSRKHSAYLDIPFVNERNHKFLSKVLNWKFKMFTKNENILVNRIHCRIQYGKVSTFLDIWFVNKNIEV